MANYDFAQLEQLWINAGGSRQLAPLAAAIAIVESGGSPTAQNQDGGASGLWQLIPSNWHFIPGGEANRFDASSNAIGAVRLSGNTLGGLISNWIDSEPPGAAYAILKQHGGTPPSGSLPASTSSTGTDSGTGAKDPGAAQLSSAWDTIGKDITDPFQSVAKSLGSLISTPADLVTSVTRIAKDFNSLVGLFNTFLRDVEWLFVPSHWIRIFAFGFGIGALSVGTWALIRTGSGQRGDITMALGILLITVAGVLLFIAFHNLPTSVVDLKSLLGYIAQGIQTGKGTPGPGLSNVFDASGTGSAQTPQEAGAQFQQTINSLGPGALPG